MARGGWFSSKNFQILEKKFSFILFHLVFYAVYVITAI